MLCFVVLNVACCMKHADQNQFYGLDIGLSWWLVDMSQATFLEAASMERMVRMELMERMVPMEPMEQMTPAH